MFFNFKTRRCADNFIKMLKEIIDTHGYASLADAYDLLEEPSQYDDTLKIWTAHPYPLIKVIDLTDVFKVCIEDPKYKYTITDSNNFKKLSEKFCIFSLYKKPKFDISTDIKKIIFNDPATIVFWEDGTKTVVKCENEKYDPEKGLAMAISKKVLGNKGNYYETFKKILPKNDVQTPHYDNVWIAYHRLINALNDKKATKQDLGIAMEEAVGYLGEALDE